MGISLGLKCVLDTMFSEAEGPRVCNHLRENLTLDSGKVFKKNLVINVNSMEMEIPIIARAHFENLIIRNQYNSKLEKIILPLYENSTKQTRRTFDSIVSQLFNVSFGCRIQKIDTPKGGVYYGGKGIILDNTYTPLLLCTLLAKKECLDGINKLNYYRPICYINPKVFLKPDDVVNKGIIKKLIPYYSNENCFLPPISSLTSHSIEAEKVKIIIDNFDKFFTEPIKPTILTYEKDALNKCLIDNIEDVMMLMQ